MSDAAPAPKPKCTGHKNNNKRCGKNTVTAYFPHCWIHRNQQNIDWDNEDTPVSHPKDPVVICGGTKKDGSPCTKKIRTYKGPNCYIHKNQEGEDDD